MFANHVAMHVARATPNVRARIERKRAVSRVVPGANDVVGRGAHLQHSVLPDAS